MRLAASFLLLAVFGAVEAALGDNDQYCEGLQCSSKAQLIEMIEKLRQSGRGIGYTSKASKPKAHNILMAQKSWDYDYTTVVEEHVTDAPEQPTCNICASLPCLNGGTCYVDQDMPWSNYTCDCPYDYRGGNCETHVECLPNSCGTNATCTVSNHQLNCVCERGFAGNPQAGYGCTQSMTKMCLTGDPHIQTYDNLYVDYQGTCPYVVNQPCTTLGGGFSDFSIKARNVRVGASDSRVSGLRWVQITFFNQIIFVDNIAMQVTFNGVLVNPTYTWKDGNNNTITIKNSGGIFFIDNGEFVTATIQTYYLCVEIPVVDAFTGLDKLCGLGGNYDGDYSDDVRYRNGTIVPLTSPYHNILTDTAVNRAQDSWITDLVTATPNVDQCITAETMGNLTNTCDPDVSAGTCLPIKQAINGTGPFAICSVMGPNSINIWYQDCIASLCSDPSNGPMCLEFKTFMDACTSVLPPDTDQGPWRAETSCPLSCLDHAHYSSCKSSCPSTCQDHESDYCQQGCTEGCICNYGYVQDNTKGGQQVVCIAVEDCGCNDPQGNSHSANSTWLTDDCSEWNSCENGTYVGTNNTCGQYAECSTAGQQMHCACGVGFTGDGYTCDDIDECNDTTTCHANTGNGVCHNTIGSYYCTCNTYYVDEHCDLYQPKRHCADLLTFNGITTSGFWTIDPPTTTSPTGPPQLVYCDMDTDGGGWTQMSTATMADESGKTFAEYVTGFGNPRDGDSTFWLGLESIAGITQAQPNSLRVDINRCPSTAQDTFTMESAYCTYPNFLVNPANKEYSVVIPTRCRGNETIADGWKRWTTAEGPIFAAFDRNDDKNCSANRFNTGFWFDTAHDCGAANLNGVRFACDVNTPDDFDSAYNMWGTVIADQSWMYLRPANFPNYDSHSQSATTTAAPEDYTTVFSEV